MRILTGWPVGKVHGIVTTNDHIVVIGAGAAGLMAARELARAGRRVTLLEARDRCGGRIYPLPAGEFGYAGRRAAPNSSMARLRSRTACCARRGFRLLPIQGTRWTMEDGKFLRRESQDPHEAELHKALQDLKDDLTVAEFLRRHFAGPRVRCGCGVPSSGWSRATTRRIRSGPARWRFATNGWMAGTARKRASSVATAPSSNFSPRSAATAALRSGSVQRYPPSKRSDRSVVVRCANGDAHGCDAVDPHRAASLF